MASPCSWLYRIEPIGRGTAEVESLSGYIARLAQAHLVPPSTLLHRGLEWWDIGQPHRVGEWQHRTTFLKFKPGINAHTTSRRWVALLEKLTCVDRLSACTLGGWSEQLPVQGLLRRHLAWCPACFAADAINYDRLLWCLPAVRACPKHRCRLMERCPQCGSHVPVIHARSVPGQCRACASPLFIPAASLPPAHDDELQVAQLVAQFLIDVARTPLTGDQPLNVAATLQDCMRKAAIADAAELSRLIGTSRITAWFWLQGREAPTFSSILKLCRCFGVSVMDFLVGRIPSLISPVFTDELSLRPVRTQRMKFDEIAVVRRIEEFCSSRRAHPPSLPEVAAAVGVTARTLRRHFTELSRSITQRSQDYVKSLVSKRREAQKETLREAIARCRAEYLRPQVADVIPFLPKPGVLRNPQARQFVQQLLLEI